MKITAGDLLEKKRRREAIVMLTSYDYPTALLEDSCGVDVQLVGDSVGTNVLGYRDVSEVTVDDMVHHVKAVARGAKRSFVLCDMPYGSFATPGKAAENSRRCADCGADGVKMEGERGVVDSVKAVADRGIPVCAHIGYTPQTRGSRATVQGKDAERATELLDVALALEQAGAFLMVLELVPERLAAEITAMVSIPTIGIGAGRFCDGQVQVVYDILGMTAKVFRHAKRYASLGEQTAGALTAYATDVRERRFPTEQNASSIPDDVLESAKQWLARRKPSTE